MTDRDTGSVPADNITQLVPKHDAVRYLQTIPGIEPDQIGFLVSLVNQTSDFDVSDVFGTVLQFSKQKLDPMVFETQDNTFIDYSLRLHQRMRQRFAAEGKPLARLTTDDIAPGELRLPFVRMSSERYTRYLQTEASKEREKDRLGLKDQFHKALDKIREKVSPEDYGRLIGMLRVSIVDDEILVSDMTPEDLVSHILLVGSIAKRLSPDWRKVVSENPWSDPELASMMEAQGVELLDHDLVLEEVRRRDESRVLRALIAEGKLSRDDLRSVVNKLIAERKVDPFISRRIGQMIEDEEVPHTEIARILRFVG